VAKISSERESFSQRLRDALQAADHSSESPTELARDFNARFAGKPITVHAARKWLVGEAIPTQDKMRALADWLGVPVEWLRFGGEERQSENKSLNSGIHADDLKLISDLQLLTPGDRQIVREFIRILVRTQRDRISSGNAQAA
jgi:hypothetical protein